MAAMGIGIGIGIGIGKGRGMSMLRTVAATFVFLSLTANAQSSQSDEKARLTAHVTNYLAGSYLKELASNGACTQDQGKGERYDAAVSALRKSVPDRYVAEVEGQVESGQVEASLGSVREIELGSKLKGADPSKRQYICGVYFGYGTALQTFGSEGLRTLSSKIPGQSQMVPR